jgi:mono/diheme cytochrome c family protein
LKREISNQFVNFESLPRIVLELVLTGLLLVALPASAQKDESPAKPATPEYKIPPEAAAKVNPVKPTAESLARARKLYGIDCAMCHGKTGDGKGDMASDIKNVTDFTNPDALKKRSDGELFYITRNGKGDDMPPEDGRAKDEDIWNLVNYVRAFAKK